jgi:hypothetical protein
VVCQLLATVPIDPRYGSTSPFRAPRIDIGSGANIPSIGMTLTQCGSALVVIGKTAVSAERGSRLFTLLRFWLVVICASFSFAGPLRVLRGGLCA